MCMQVREREEVDVLDDQGCSARTDYRHRTHKHSPQVSLEINSAYKLLANPGFFAFFFSGFYLF